jgi:ribonuclease-3
MIANPYRALEKNLGYRFRRKQRLMDALTHRSYRYENEGTDRDNQRLEFLGDAALGLVTAAYLYRKYPDLPEGELTKYRSRVTSSRPLAELALACGLGEHLRLGRGETLSGGHERQSNLTDAMEAVLGAAYTDGGIRAVERIFEKLVIPYFERLHPSHALDNPKGHLQEIAQGRWKTTPRYRVVAEDGPCHGREFTVEVSLMNQVMGQGTGRNKREAQMAAARAALDRVEALQEIPDMAPKT